MRCCSIICVVLCMSIVTGKQKYLINSKHINSKLLEELYNEKIWTANIDKLLTNIPITNTQESMYTKFTLTISLAKHWCSIPQSYIGKFQNVSLNTMIAHHNVSDWLPCGVIVHQYYLYANIKSRTNFFIEVNKHFHINVSVIESHLRIGTNQYIW